MKYLVLAAVSFFALHQSAFACSCGAPPPPQKAMQGSAAVFLGDVVAIERVGFQLKVTFEVTKVRKGDVGQKIVSWTNSNGAACGYSFNKKVKSYLVYAYSMPNNAAGKRRLATDICTRTRQLAGANEDLNGLGEGKKPAAG